MPTRPGLEGVYLKKLQRALGLPDVTAAVANPVEKHLPYLVEADRHSLVTEMYYAIFGGDPLQEAPHCIQ